MGGVLEHGKIKSGIRFKQDASFLPLERPSIQKNRIPFHETMKLTIIFCLLILRVLFCWDIF